MGLLTFLACAGSSPGATTSSATCASSRDCLGWESCSPAGECGAARACSTAADCVPGDGCSADGWCSAPQVLDPDQVAIVGRITRGLLGVAIAPVDAPTHLIPLYPEMDTVVHRARLLPSGSVVYLASEIDTSGPSPVVQVHLRRLVPDAWIPGSGFWSPPLATALDNDPILPSPACVPTEFVVRHTTGEILHNCAYGTDWYDLQGTLRAEGPRVHAWNGSGAMLVEWPGEPYLGLRSAAGGRVSGSGGPFASWYRASRVRGSAFWVLASNRITRRAERWLIQSGGNGRTSAALEGEYPPRTCDSDFDHVCEEQILDASGAAYRLRWEVIDGSLTALVERCALGAQECEIMGDPRLVEFPVVTDDYVGPPPWLAHAELSLPMLTGP